MAYYPDFADAANYPYLFFASETAVKDGMNGSNFKNAEVDAFLKIANEKADPKARADALKGVFKIANEDVALVPIFWPASAMAINNKYKLTGYTAFWYNIPWAIRGFGKNKRDAVWAASVIRNGWASGHFHRFRRIDRRSRARVSGR